MSATLIMLFALAVGTGPDAPPAIECETGPVPKSFGGSAWQVFSCVDGKSIVLVAEQGSKAFPFYFMVTPQEAGIRLYGEGTGESKATRAAFTELNRFTATDVAAIVTETQSVR